MRNTFLSLLWITAAVFIADSLMTAADAAIVAQHSGQNDPTTEGFTLTASELTSSATGNDGYDYFELTTTAEKQGYYLDDDVVEADFEDPSGWTATFIVRTFEGSSAGRGSTIMYVDDGDYLVDTCLVDGTGSYARGLWLKRAGTGFAYLGDLDPTVYHIYQTVYDPITDGSIVSFYVDGIFFADYYMSGLYEYTAGAYFGFGDGSSSADTAANVNRWAECRLETGVQIVGFPGDADRNGTVDEADAAILAENWLSSGATWDMGDFNDDNVVDDKDVTIMAANWGKVVTLTGGTAVPEPSVFVTLVAVGLAVCLTLRRRMG